MINIKIELDPSFNRPNNSYINTLLSKVMNSEGIKVADILLIFGKDDLLNKLKKEFFKLDQLTDVIAFRLNEYHEKNVEGEIYISLPRAQENAEIFKENINKEITRLIVHGSLHLINYDDSSVAEKAIMTKKENYYLNQCDWTKLYD